jgi:hypothetical protein
MGCHTLVFQKMSKDTVKQYDIEAHYNKACVKRGEEGMDSLTFGHIKRYNGEYYHLKESSIQQDIFRLGGYPTAIITSYNELVKYLKKCNAISRIFDQHKQFDKDLSFKRWECIREELNPDTDDQYYGYIDELPNDDILNKFKKAFEENELLIEFG